MTLLVPLLVPLLLSSASSDSEVRRYDDEHGRKGITRATGPHVDQPSLLKSSGTRPPSDSEVRRYCAVPSLIS